jgi:hypothetical protein
MSGYKIRCLQNDLRFVQESPSWTSRRSLWRCWLQGSGCWPISCTEYTASSVLFPTDYSHRTRILIGRRVDTMYVYVSAIVVILLNTEYTSSGLTTQPTPSQHTPSRRSLARTMFVSSVWARVVAKHFLNFTDFLKALAITRSPYLWGMFRLPLAACPPDHIKGLMILFLFFYPLFPPASCYSFYSPALFRTAFCQI